MKILRTIVIADADGRRRQAVAARLAANSEVRECVDNATLLSTLAQVTPAVVVIGSLGSGPADVIEAALAVREMHAGAKVIVVADYSSECFAIGALRARVSDYLKSPVDTLELEEAILRAAPLHEDLSDGFEDLIGVSQAIQAVKRLIRMIGPLDSTVLISGESGTGKEIVARLLHQHSRRAKAAFVCVNCAALPDSLVESELFGHERGAFTGAVAHQNGQMKNADQGTLFLDEIGDMSGLAQCKMLRALEERKIRPLGGVKPIPIDVRLITATHRNLETLVAEEKFRGDLYYRLDVSRIDLPSLRERREDIPILAEHFLRIMNRKHGRHMLGFTPAALQTLVDHDWPGNVRQLRNVIEAASAMSSHDWITDGSLRALRSFSASGPPLQKTAVTAVVPTKQLKVGKDALIEALEATHWNMTRAAELLRWSRSTLYRRISQYQIQRDAERIEAPHHSVANA